MAKRAAVATPALEPHPGERVVLWRTRYGWTQQELATHAGVALSTVKRVELGQDVRRQSLQAIAKALGKTLAYLETPIE